MMTFNPRFLQLKDKKERRHDKSGLCFLTQYEILVLKFQMLFEGNNQQLTCSDYCRISFYIAEIIASLQIFATFTKISEFFDEYFCLIDKT